MTDFPYDTEAIGYMREAADIMSKANGGRYGDIRQRREKAMDRLHKALLLLASANEEQPRFKVVK